MGIGTGTGTGTGIAAGTGLDTGVRTVVGTRTAGAGIGTSTDIGTGTCSIFSLVQFPIRNKRLKKPHLNGQKRLHPNNPQGGTVSFWQAKDMIGTCQY
jgi:hypothetical protein